MKKGIIFKAAIIVFAMVFVFSGYNIVKISLEYSAAKKLYSSIQTEYTKPIAPPSTNENDAELQVKEPAIEVDFTALKNKNSEAVGWLYMPNSVLNYPVAQASDNSKYISTDFSGKHRSSGALFADFRNGALGEDANYIIYGHHMKNGTMLSTIVKYKKQVFFDENPVMYYFTPEKTYKIEFIAGRVVPSDAEIYNIPQTKQEFLRLVNDHYIKHSTFKSNITPTEEDSFITLSTCSYEYDEARYVLIGRLIDIVEE